MNTENFIRDFILSGCGFEPPLYSESLVPVNGFNKISHLWESIFAINILT